MKLALILLTFCCLLCPAQGATQGEMVSEKEVSGSGAVLYKTRVTLTEKSELPLPLALTRSKGAVLSADAKKNLNVIVNGGAKSWDLWSENGPAEDRQLYSSALAEGVSSPLELTGWQPPVYRKYVIEYENASGFTIAKFTLRISYTYGGSFKGTGSYLTGVSAFFDDVFLAGGYKLKAMASVETINKGTAKQPVALMTLNIFYEIAAPAVSIKAMQQFTADGNGNFEFIK